MSTEPAASVRLTNVLDGRPPLARLVVDVILANPNTSPTWFVLPDQCGSAYAGVGPVNGGSVRRLAGSGRVPLAHFEGQRGFYCLLIPGPGQIRLHGLLVDAETGTEQEDSAEQVDTAFEVLACRQVLVDGEPADRWLGIDLWCDARADANAGTGLLVAERWPPELPELPVNLAGARRMSGELSTG